jgi:uncharacterized OB-fold protein
MYANASSGDQVDVMTVSTNRAISTAYPRSESGNRVGLFDTAARRLPGSVRMAPTRPLPRPTPETQHFWDGTAAGELRLQRCRACDHTYFPPQPFCPRCASDDVDVVQASGRASLYSYVITERAAPGFEAPYVIAEVELEEGPRLLSNLVDVAPDPDGRALDLPLEVTFESSGEVALPVFRPRAS